MIGTKKQRIAAYARGAAQRRSRRQAVARVTARISRGVSGGNNDIHTIVTHSDNLTVGPTSLTSSAVGAVAGAFSFQLNQTQDSSNYGNIWDQYRIKTIIARITCLTSGNQAATSTSNAPMVVAVDYDDAGAPANALVLMSFQNAKMICPGSEPLTIKFHPHVATNLNNFGGTSVARANQGYQWIDCASQDIPHYGLKFYIYQNTTTNQTVYYMFFTYVIEFKNNR